MADGPAPVEFSDTKNVAWKASVPGRGHSTPVIAGNRIFVTTAIAGAPAAPPPPPPAAAPPEAPPAGGPPRRGPGGFGSGSGGNVENTFVVMAFDKSSGKLLWQQTANKAVTHEGYHQRYGSFASYAPATDGKFVYAMFGSYGLYCYDLNGKLVWKKDLPQMKMLLSFGEGGAPVIAGDKLILKLDQQSGSQILVLNKNTGAELWRKDRDEASSWSNPLVLESGGKQLAIVSATKMVRAYDLANGDVVWECGGLGANVIPAPVVSGGIVIVMSGFRNPNLLAIKLGRTGNLTGTDAVVWTNDRGNSYTPSPVLHNGKLYVLTDNGTLSCFNAATGEAYYRQQRLPKPYNFKASPIMAGGNLYLASEEGDVLVVKGGETFELLATNTLPDQFFVASPVAVDGMLFLRGAGTLFAIKQ